MLCTVVRSTGVVRNINLLFERCTAVRPVVVSQRNVNTTKKTSENLEEDEPIPYSTSDAAKWLAAYSRAPPNDRPKIEGPVLLASVGVLLLYFCIFRESNDIDLMVDQALPGIWPKQNIESKE